MFNILLAVQIIVAIAMIGLILIQHGKGADAGASFGAGASGTVFGAAGSANFLTRATAVLAAIFFATSILLAILAKDQSNDQYSLEVPATTEVATASEIPTAEKPATTDKKQTEEQ
ncbi:preprotein translocase subunit SecG [Psychrobacter sp. HD31]|uniref:preprotein translocase subunit SecG n=1 Tax=Psychrobacter sp. HD31 TaxID=3112003 RepID=UPI003DA537AD